jgi:ketosteroid isomerase-like protein
MPAAGSVPESDRIEVAYDAWNRRDLNALLELTHPELEARSYIMDAEGAVYRGREGMRRFFEDLVSVFPDWRVEIVSTRAAGDAIVVELRVSGKAAGSGLALSEIRWQVVRFRDGLILSLSGYATEAEALADARGE